MIIAGNPDIQVLILSVNGKAFCPGRQLVATCDLTFTAEGMRFGVNGANIGLFCSTPMAVQSCNIPRKRAFKMLSTG